MDKEQPTQFGAQSPAENEHRAAVLASEAAQASGDQTTQDSE